MLGKKNKPQPGPKYLQNIYLMKALSYKKEKTKRENIRIHTS